tara:strand:+ start:4369 stop:4707 length:339 start_codon:yes stop_codon:yes gene_type:complete
MEPLKTKTDALCELVDRLDVIISTRKHWRFNVAEDADSIVVKFMRPLKYRDAIMEHRLSIEALQVPGTAYVNDQLSIMSGRFVSHIEEQRFKEKMAINRKNERYHKKKKRRN